MAASAILSTAADSDLETLYFTVATENGTERAELILRRIQATIAALADWPRIGRCRDNLDGTPRVFAIPPWIIVYEAQPNGDGIYVWRVVDGRRDLQNTVHRPVA